MKTIIIGLVYLLISSILGASLKANWDESDEDQKKKTHSSLDDFW